MRFPVVDVEEKGSILRQDTMGLLNSRREKPQKIIKLILILRGVYPLRSIALPSESGAVTLLVSHGTHSGMRLSMPRVERRIDVDKVMRCVGQCLQHLKIVSAVYVEAVNARIDASRSSRRAKTMRVVSRAFVCRACPLLSGR